MKFGFETNLRPNDNTLEKKNRQEKKVGALGWVGQVELTSSVRIKLALGVN